MIQFTMAYRVVCYPQNNNAYSGNLVGGVHLPWALSSFNNVCDSLATWYDSNNPGTMAWGTNLGYWVGVTDKYLALKLIVGANTYYGWARLDFLASSGSFTIKDYAYERTPNACIKLRQTTLGVNENTNGRIFSAFPNPFTSSTTIQVVGNLNNATLTVCNLHGQTVKQIKNISGQTFSFSCDNLASGVYFVRLTEENKIIGVEKIVIID
jgi:hypothetical protein